MDLQTVASIQTISPFYNQRDGSLKQSIKKKSRDSIISEESIFRFPLGWPVWDRAAQFNSRNSKTLYQLSQVIDVIAPGTLDYKYVNNRQATLTKANEGCSSSMQNK